MIPAGRFPFVALEGTDGAGKSTVRDEIRSRLTADGRACMLVGQHGWLCPDSSRVLIDVRAQRHGWSATEISDAYFRDKQLHAQASIRPALAAAPVIADRFVYSDAVYHEVLYGIPMERTLERHRSGGTLVPDAVVFVAVSLDDALARIEQRAKAKRSYENRETLALIIDGYWRLFTGPLRELLPPVVIFDNTDPDWRDRVARDLLPLVSAPGAGLVPSEALAALAEPAR
ncbi:MAG TPA: hypothetical protein VFQ85_15665 [Mycobacteriales bacterium]|nr:hypothetical protein [Mycobacteriales bacterium]